MDPRVPGEVSKWFRVVLDPNGFFRDVNEEETGQRHALFFFTGVVLLARLPDVILNGTTPFEFLLIAAVILLLSPPVLHVLSGIQYLALWLAASSDRGVDRTLRAVAYGAAPAVLAWVPVIGVIAFYGAYLQYVGLRAGHELSRWRAAAAAAVPAVLLYGLVFNGFHRLESLLRFLESVAAPLLALA